jgi:hypothetical protein
MNIVPNTRTNHSDCATALERLDPVERNVRIERCDDVTNTLRDRERRSGDARRDVDEARALLRERLEHHR